MMKPGDSVTLDFTTHLATGALSDADALPTAVLVRNGTDTAEAVTVTNKATGQYKAAVAVPAGYAAGDLVQVRVSCTVGGVAGGGIIWSAQLDTKRVSDLNDLAAGAAMALTADYDAAKTAAQAGDAMTLTAATVDAILDEQIGDGTLTARQVLRALVAGMFAKVSGSGTTTITFRNTADSQDVAIVTLDGAGNRTGLTLTP